MNDLMQILGLTAKKKTTKSGEVGILKKSNQLLKDFWENRRTRIHA